VPVAPPRRRRKPKGETVLRPVRASAAIEAEYRRRLDCLIDEMAKSVLYWVRATLRANPTAIAELAEDRNPVEATRAAIARLAKRWTKRIDDAAPKLAAWFATAVHQRSDAVLKKILRDSGIAIKWEMSAAEKQAVTATMTENVALIKNIPAQALTQIEGIVMRGVSRGADIGGMAKEIEAQIGVTKRRARFIARDQNNKANATMQRTRQLELLGATAEAVWCHSAGGHTPRPSHVKAGREKTRYLVADGWFDPDENRKIFPGELVNCKCYSRLIVKGFG
jgi:uncharacterized protein with gpF-like domain